MKSVFVYSIKSKTQSLRTVELSEREDNMLGSLGFSDTSELG